MPKRIQRRRAAGWRMPENTVYVGRPTKWGNPFKYRSRVGGLARSPAIHYPGREWEYEGRISAAGMRHDFHHGDGRVTVCHVRYMSRAETVECYRAWITGSGWPIDWTSSAPTYGQIRDELAGKDLACWCPPELPCHADVLLQLAAHPWPAATCARFAAPRSSPNPAPTTKPRH